MKTNFTSLFWGLLLMVAGGFALAIEMDVLREPSERTWMLIFGAASVLFFIAYFVNGIQAWGWLFPALISAAISGTLFIVDTSIPDEWIATLVVGSVAVPFVVAFLLDRSRWGLLIPAFVLGFVALVPPLALAMPGEKMGAFIVAMIGLPFLGAYLLTPKAWWGIIPAGILLSIAAMIVLTETRFGFDPGTFAVGMMFLGWALTFGLVWLRRGLHAAPWALYPAIVLGVLAGILFLPFDRMEVFWAIGLILAGLVLVVIGLRPRREPAGPA